MEQKKNDSAKLLITAVVVIVVIVGFGIVISNEGANQNQTSSAQTQPQEMTDASTSSSSITYTSASLYTLSHDIQSVPLSPDTTGAYFIETSGTVASYEDFTSGNTLNHLIYIKDNNGDAALVFAGTGEDAEDSNIVSRLAIGDTVDVQGIYLNPTSDSPAICDPNNTGYAYTKPMCNKFGISPSTGMISATTKIIITK